MRPETVRLLGIIQLVMEGLIAIGFLLGMIPFVYLWSSGWVIPLTLISVVFALITNNGTLIFTILNVALALLSFIPLLGFLTRLAGACVSLINIAVIRRQL